MVVRIKYGKKVEGAIRYNERKVEKHNADFLLAENYPKDTEALSVRDRIAYLKQITSRNTRAAYKAMHISLNFSPEDNLDNHKLQEIIRDYMEQIGFAGQPYLAYQHFDAAHPHVHIVTSLIRENARTMYVHNLAKRKSEPARRAIEDRYDLVVAEGRTWNPKHALPFEPLPILHGREETKAAISNVVQGVVNSYRFASIDELNAVLRQFNLIADPGHQGSRQFISKGLVYSLLDDNGDRVGPPIKASVLSFKPTLANLERRFPTNIKARAPYRQRVRLLVDKAVRSPKVAGWEQFRAALRPAGIELQVNRDEVGRVTSINYVDNRTKVVFSGSDLGSAYDAVALSDHFRGTLGGDPAEFARNQAYTRRVFAGIDFNIGIEGVIRQLASRGVAVTCRAGRDGELRYLAGFVNIKEQNFMPLDQKQSAYFRGHGLAPLTAARILEQLRQHYPVRGITINPASADPISEALERTGSTFIALGGALLSALNAVLDEWLKVERSYGTGFYLPGARRKKKKKK